MYVHMYNCTCTYVRTCTYIHVYIHVCTYVHTSCPQSSPSHLLYRQWKATNTPSQTTIIIYKYTCIMRMYFSLQIYTSSTFSWHRPLCYMWMYRIPGFKCVIKCLRLRLFGWIANLIIAFLIFPYRPIAHA